MPERTNVYVLWLNIDMYIVTWEKYSLVKNEKWVWNKVMTIIMSVLNTDTHKPHTYLHAHTQTYVHTHTSHPDLDPGVYFIWVTWILFLVFYNVMWALFFNILNINRVNRQPPKWEKKLQNICKLFIWQGNNIENIQVTQTKGQEQIIWFKMGKWSKWTFFKRRYTRYTNNQVYEQNAQQH